MVDTTKLAAGAGAAGLLAFALAGRGSADTPPDENEQPYADFDVNNDGLTISADASGSNDPADGQLVAYEWRLSTGNGISVTTGAGETFSYTVSSAGAGTYTLELTVTDDDGATDTASQTFDVVAPNQGPLAQFEVTTNGLSISADGSLSDDPDGQIVDYEWSLIRRTDNADVSFPIQVGDSYSQTVNSEGTYEITLTVTDDRGDTATASQTIDVEEPNVPPEVSFTTSTDGLVLSANAQAAVDPDGSIVAYDWTLLDDAGGQVVTGKSAQFAYTVPSGGTYTLELVVTDNEGLTASDTQSVDVVEPNEAPVAQFNSDTDGLTITADAGDAYDPDGEIVAYDWALQTSGDNIQTIADQTGQNFSTTVPSGGYYTLTLQVTDDRGAQRTVNQGFNVVEPNEAPTANFAVSTDGLIITADGTGSTDPDGSIESYDWSLQQTGGGGVTYPTQTGRTFDETVDAAGTYELTLTVTDDRGGTHTRRKSVTVEEPAPSLTITDLYVDGSTVVVESDIANATEMELKIYGGTNIPDGGTSYDVIADTGWIGVAEYFSAGVYNSYDSLAVDFTVRNGDGEEDYQFDTADFSDGGGGGGGDTGSATADITSYINNVNDEIVVDGSDSTAGGGSIESYKWRLYAYAGSSKETEIETESGRETSLGLYYSADYRLELTVTAADGSTDTAQETFNYTSGYESEIYVKNDANPMVAKQTVQIDFEATFDANLAGGSVENEADGDREVTATLGPRDDMRIQYDGDISTFDWYGGCIRVEDGNGERVDPFDMTTGGPRNRWLGGTDEVFEVTIYETEELFDINGMASARILADWLAGGLRKRGVSYDILYDMPIIRVPSQDTGCYNPYWYASQACEDDDNCDGFDCCAPEDLLPAALYWWDNARTGGTLHEQHNEETGANVDAPLGSTYVQRKDSNILLTAAGGGGCGFSTSTQPQCVGPGRNIDRALRFDSTGSSVGLDTDFISNIHDCLHEIGHNLEFKHPGPEGCDLGGGEGWIDDDGRWHRTPCIAHTGCENYCGTYVEDNNSPERDYSLNAYKHPVYTECTIEYFMQEMGPEQGSIQPLAQSAAVGDEAPSCDCGLGEANGSTVARADDRSAENDNVWG